MKNLVYLMILFCVALTQTSCNTYEPMTTLHNNEKGLFTCCNHQTAYYLNGGDKGLLNDLYSTLLKTAPVTQDSIKGRAIVKFKVLEDGSIDPNSIKIIRNKSVPEVYMDAAIEAIKNLGKFEPGKTNGTPKNVWFNLPILYPVPLDKIITEK